MKILLGNKSCTCVWPARAQKYTCGPVSSLVCILDPRALLIESWQHLVKETMRIRHDVDVGTHGVGPAGM